MARADDDALARLVRGSATRHTPPAALQARVTLALRETVAAADQAAAPAATPAATARRWWPSLLWFGAGNVTAAMAGFLAWMLAGTLAWPLPAERWGAAGHAAPQRLAAAATASHVRALMSGHLTDVASSDRHTVKPWFAGKVDFAPPVVDLAAAGYPLVGGRLDQLDGGPVAALVYRAGPHVINLFVWPAADGNGTTAAQPQVERGYQLLHWSQAGMQVWAVSDMGPAELAAFAAQLRERLATPPP